MIAPSSFSSVICARRSLPTPAPSARWANIPATEPRKKKQEITAVRERAAMIFANRVIGVSPPGKGLSTASFPGALFDSDPGAGFEDRGQARVQVLDLLHRAAVLDRDVPQAVARLDKVVLALFLGARRRGRKKPRHGHGRPLGNTAVLGVRGGFRIRAFRIGGIGGVRHL